MSQATAVGSRSLFSNERPAYSIYPPAIVRHVVFRLGVEENPAFAKEDVKVEQMAELCRSLARHVNGVRDAYGLGHAPIEIVSNPGEADGTRKFSYRRSILVEAGDAAEQGYRLRIRVDIYGELFTISYLIDRIDVTKPGPLQAEFAKLPHDFSNIDWLFERVWAAPDFPPGVPIRDWAAQRMHPNCTREFGEPIADFRTLLLCPRSDWTMEEPSLEFSRIAVSSETQMAPDVLAFASAHRDLIHHVAGTNNADASGEAIVCGMSGGLALYAAELGQWGASAKTLTPVHVLVVYAGHSHAQLGRLLRRQHVLGELRHAAVLDWDLGSDAKDLKYANLRLRDLSKRIDEATRNPSVTEIKGILRELVEIGRVAEGGLSFRIEQSRYYAEAYIRMVDDLRIIRIGGWQPYNDFVNRYVFQLFGRIDRIGRLYDDLGRRLDRIMFYEQAKSLDHYQVTVTRALNELKAATTEMKQAGVRQVELLDHLKASTNAVHEAGRYQITLLKTAELFAFIFVIYYLGTILESALFPDKGYLIRMDSAAWWKIIYDIAWFIAALSLSAFLISRVWRSRRPGAKVPAAPGADTKGDGAGQMDVQAQTSALPGPDAEAEHDALPKDEHPAPAQANAPSTSPTHGSP